jgi:hypothetical protein
MFSNQSGQEREEEEKGEKEEKGTVLEVGPRCWSSCSLTSVNHAVNCQKALFILEA